MSRARAKDYGGEPATAPAHSILNEVQIATMVQDYLPLVVSQVDRVWLSPRTGLTRDDLVSAGCYGLLLAARRFDPGRGVGFGVFARSHVHGAMMREINVAMRASGVGQDEVLAFDGEPIEPDDLPDEKQSDGVDQTETAEVRDLMECLLTGAGADAARALFLRRSDTWRNRCRGGRFREFRRAWNQGRARETQSGDG